MYVTYSPDIEGIYITISDAPVASSVEISDLVTVDVDGDGRPVGVEFVMRAENLRQEHWVAVCERFPELSPQESEQMFMLNRVLPALRVPASRKPFAGSEDATNVVVIGLREDTVAETAATVSQIGGRATVAVVRGNVIVSMTWDMTFTDVELDLDSDSNVHPNSTLGVLVDYMATQSVFSFRIAVSETRLAAVEGSHEPLLQPA